MVKVPLRGFIDQADRSLLETRRPGDAHTTRRQRVLLAAQSDSDGPTLDYSSMLVAEGGGSGGGDTAEMRGARRWSWERAHGVLNSGRDGATGSWMPPNSLMNFAGEETLRVGLSPFPAGRGCCQSGRGTAGSFWQRGYYPRATATSAQGNLAG